MNERVYSRERASSPLAATGGRNRSQLQSRDSSNSITSNTASSSSSSTSSNLSNLSLTDIEEADQLPSNDTVVGAADVSADATIGSRGSQRPPARTAYSGLSSVGIGFRGFQNNSILSPAQRIAKESLPSPPATSKGGESERGSIGSAQGQERKPEQASNSKRKNLALDDMQAYGAEGAYATVRRSPVNTSSIGKRAQLDQVIAYSPSTQYTRQSHPSHASSHTLQSSLSRSVSPSTRLQPRSVSPLVATTSLSSAASASSLHGHSRTRCSETENSAQLADDSNLPSYSEKTLSRTGSTTSISPHDGRVSVDYKGKGREDSSLNIERKPSISASKIRKASKASRAKIYSTSDLQEESLSTNSSDHLKSSPSSSSLLRDKSLSSDSSHIDGTILLEPALSRSSQDRGPALKRQSLRVSSSRSSLTGSEAFVNNSRNSMISLASRESNANQSLPDSHGTLNGLYKLASPSNPDRSLEEGEILEETPPPGMDRVHSYEDRSSDDTYRREPQRHRRQERPLSNGDKPIETDQHPTRSSHRTDRLSVAALEQLSGRSTTPSPSTGLMRPLSAPSYGDSQEGGSRYGNQRTPYRSSKTTSNGRPSTSGSSTSRDQYEPSISESYEISKNVDDTLRTPRRTPYHHRRYESAQESRADYPPRTERTRDALRSTHDKKRNAAPSASADVTRPQISLSRYTRQTTQPADARPATSQAQVGRSLNPSQGSESRLSNSRGLPRSYSTTSEMRNDLQDSASSTRSYRSNRQKGATPSSTMSQYSERNAPRRSDVGERPSSRLSVGRTTPRMRDQGPSSSGPPLSSFPSSHSRSVRSLSSQAEHRPEDAQVQSYRSRSRTLSDRERALARPVSQADVFVDSRRNDEHNKHSFRTLPSSATRARLGLRDLEVASPGWWQEVSEIRDKAVNASVDRPMSRASTHRSLASTTSPESAGARAETASRLRTARSTLSSTPSNASLAGAARTPANSISASARYSMRASHEHSERPYTPYRDSPSRPASRSAYSRGCNAPQSAQGVRKLGDMDGHYHLLQDALHSLQDIQSEQPNVAKRDLVDFERITSAVVENAIRQSTLSQGMWKDVAESQVELELASDTEDGGQAMSRRHRSFLSRFDRSSAQAHRLSEEQVRGLTELLIVLGKLQKVTRPDQITRKPSLDLHENTRSPIRGSATLPSGSRERHHDSPHGDSSEAPASIRRPRHVNTLERIDSIADEIPAVHHARASRVDPHVPSPRALQRAKSTTTSQISQNTVKGYMTSSPTKESGGYFPPISQGSDIGKRPSSRASQRSYHSPAGSQVSIRVAGDSSLESEDISAIGRLESQLAKTSVTNGSSRWRPFSQRRPLPQRLEEELPDSPALNGQDHRANRSSELARTLSRMSSRVLRP